MSLQTGQITRTRLGARASPLLLPPRTPACNALNVSAPQQSYTVLQSRSQGIPQSGAGLQSRKRRPCAVSQAVSVDTLIQTVEAVPPQAPEKAFFYDGVVFDMDGTLTEAHIDFADMRARTGIPMGDLFTVMESWEDPGQIDAAMRVILDIEAEAASRVSAKEGLIEMLQMLKRNKVRVALVTRNTKASVQKFLDLIGPEWASLFNIILTREFQYVKPDKRLLLHVAQVWDVEPSKLLMVGDSLEDVEVGNAAGTATCLVAGGGNEKPGAAPAAPPPGAVPTFAVSGLPELTRQLEQASRALSLASSRRQLEHAMVMSSADSSMDEESGYEGLQGSGAPQETWSGMTVQSLQQTVLLEELQQLQQQEEEEEQEAQGPLSGRVALGWPARVAAGEHVDSDGAPPPGLAFLDWLMSNGALKAGEVSFPRMGAAAGGLASCSEEELGDLVLHVCCGPGGLTKMLASQGMKVVGVCSDVSAAQKRGLQAVPFSAPRPLMRHSLQGVKSVAAAQAFDVVLMCCEGVGSGPEPTSSRIPEQWWSGEALQEAASLLAPDGRLCAQVSLRVGGRAVNPAVIINSINSTGMTVVAWQLLRPTPSSEANMLRLVARQNNA